MMWDEYDLAKKIQKDYWVKYDPEKFTFARPKRTKAKDDWWELIELWFIVNETQEIFKLPMKWNNLEALKMLE